MGGIKAVHRHWGVRGLTIYCTPYLVPNTEARSPDPKLARRVLRLSSSGKQEDISTARFTKRASVDVIPSDIRHAPLQIWAHDESPAPGKVIREVWFILASLLVDMKAGPPNCGCTPQASGL